MFTEVYKNAADAWPCFTLRSDPNPTEIGKEAVFRVTAVQRITKDNLGGAQVKLVAGNPPELCQITLGAQGTGNCNVTFDKPARDEPVRISYSSTGLPPLISEPYVHTIGKSEGYWSGTYLVSNCTELPVGSLWRMWYWQTPCGASLPLQSGKGAFYFDDFSSEVIFESKYGNVNNYESEQYNIRSVVNLRWRSDSDRLTHSIPTAYSTIQSDQFHKPVSIVESGTLTFTFTVNSRTDTSISGTFLATMRSGYLKKNFGGRDSIGFLPTSATGIWRANLIAGSKPNTQMMGFDFCQNKDNTGMHQRAAPSISNVGEMPTYSPDLVPGGCRYQ